MDAITAAVDADRAPSPMLRALARLDFPLVITTNYDALFERALRDAGKQPRVSVYEPELTLRWRIDAAQVPDTYSVDLQLDPLILDVWQSQRRYVKFIAQDVWSFGPQLYELVHGEELAP